MKFPKKHQNRQSFLKFNRQSFKFNKETNRIKSGKTRKKSLYFSSVKFFFCFIEEEMTGSNVSNSTPLYFHLTEIERTFTRISNVRIKQQVYVKANKKMLVHQAIQLGGETHKCFCIFFQKGKALSKSPSLNRIMETAQLRVACVPIHLFKRHLLQR